MAEKINLIDVVQNANVQKMLSLIAKTEGTDRLHGYNTLVGGSKIQDTSKHPNIVGLETADGKSTAAGRYQITGTTWRGLQKKYGLGNDFSPSSQDLAAVALMKDAGALDSILKGDFKGGINKVKNIWVSLPGSSTKNQREVSWDDVNKYLGINPKKQQMSNIPSDQVERRFANKINAAEKKQTNGVAKNQQSIQSQISNVFQAYNSGKMTPADKAAFESDIKNGLIQSPKDFQFKNQQDTQQQQGIQSQISNVFQAYNDNKMTSADKAEFESDIKNGLIQAPKDFQFKNEESLGILSTISNAVGSAVDMFTGDDRATVQSNQAGDWINIPELNDPSVKGLGVIAASANPMSSPAELAQIIKTNFPGVQVTQDEKGNQIFKSAIDGKEYAVKPGFQPSDVLKLAAPVAATAALPAGIGIAGSVGLAAAGQGVSEGIDYLTGGNFNAGNVAAAGAFGAVPGLISKAAPTVKNAIKTAAGKVIPKSTQQGAAQAGVNAVEQKLQQATYQPPKTQNIAQNVINAVKNPAIGMQQPQMGLQQLGAKARRAAEGVIGSKKATVEFAQGAAPNIKTLEAAKRLGIDEYLQPDHITTNQSFRELSQAIKSIPGSQARSAELQGLSQVAKKADDIITEIGGSNDLSTLNFNVKKTLEDSQKDLSEKAKALYDKVDASIPLSTKIDTPNLKAYIDKRISDLGGVESLEAGEKQAIKLLKIDGDVQPTYGALDSLRKRINAVKFGSTGAFANTTDKVRNDLINSMRADQKQIAVASGLGDTWELAQKISQTKKGVQNDLTALFGKQLDKSITSQLATATKALPSGDASKFIELLKVIPADQRQQTVAGGLLTAFGKNAKNGDLNFNSYAKWYEGLLRNKKSYAAIMSNLPSESRRQLKDLYRVSKGISLSSKERIETGRINAAINELKEPDTIMSSLYSLAKRSILGLGAEMITTILGMPGAGITAGVASALTKGKTPALKAIDNLIISPDFQMLARSINTKNEKSAIKKIASSKDFVKVLNVTGNKDALKNKEKFLTLLLKVTAPKTQNNQNNKNNQKWN